MDYSLVLIYSHKGYLCLSSCLLLWHQHDRRSFQPCKEKKQEPKLLRQYNKEWVPPVPDLTGISWVGKGFKRESLCLVDCWEISKMQRQEPDEHDQKEMNEKWMNEKWMNEWKMDEWIDGWMKNGCKMWKKNLEAHIWVVWHTKAIICVCVNILRYLVLDWLFRVRLSDSKCNLCLNLLVNWWTTTKNNCGTCLGELKLVRWLIWKSLHF